MMPTANISSDMEQFIDFGDATMLDFPRESADPVLSEKENGCPAHGDSITDGGRCHDFQEDIPLPHDLPSEYNEVHWNSDFSTWLPRYQKPEQPCDYCRSRSLECFVYNAGGEKSSGCSPCNALFRSCSFSAPEKMPIQKSRTALDTLDVVAEDSERHFGGFTGRKPMRCLGHVGPIENETENDRPKKGTSAARFSRPVVKVLKDWMLAHIDHPYPTEEDKEVLKAQTGLTISQISGWMANTRRRQKNRPKRAASPSIRPSTEPVNIPAGRTWDDLNPFERWKHSPPENEPAPLTAIAQAVESFNPPDAESLSSSYNGRGNSNSSTGSFSVFRAPSTASFETGLSSGSQQSHGTVWSQGSRNSFGSLNSLNSKTERRRRRRMPMRTPKLDLESTPRLFQCTFCTDRFKSKYDWARHEKSLHLSLEKWICAPLGEVITCTASGQRKCVYCDALDPTQEHLDGHNHKGCYEKGHDARTFYRKDHLRQHLRLMHSCKLLPSMESWKAEAQFIRSRCGFCGMNFNKWQDRVDHLAKEFRNGASMADWKGCRGLDPQIASLVTNAMPPYLIANESKSPFPFSATNSASMKQHVLPMQQDDLEFLLPTENSKLTDAFTPYNVRNDSSSSLSRITPRNIPDNSSSAATPPRQEPNANCWEILTLRLGRFARQQIEKNGLNSLTDEVLQSQARFILYGCDDPWNQTSADNPEWLGLFKKSHGIPTETPWPAVTSQHEIYEDLGVRPGARMDPSFDLKHFDCVSRSQAMDPSSLALAYECSLSGSVNMSKMGMSTHRMSGSHTPITLPELGSTSTSLGSNFPATSSFEARGLHIPAPEMSFTTPGGECIGENGELGYPSGRDGASSDNAAYCLPVSTTCLQNPATCALLDGDSPQSTKEQACNKLGEATADSFSFPTWSQLPHGFEHSNMANGFSSSISGNAGFGAPGITASDVIEGDVNNAQVMRWNEAEFGFDLDMDLDLNVDFVAASNGLN